MVKTFESHHKSKHERLGARYWKLMLLVMLCLFIALAAAAFFYLRTRDNLSRLTVVSIGDPMVVWSQDLRSNKFIQINIPASAQVDAVGGYGRYSLEALWKLGAIDKKNGTLVSDSLEEALGISIPWYLDVSPGRWLPRTNMPLPLLLSWIWRTRSVKPDRTTEVAITPQTALFVQDLPDGTRAAVVDPARVDTLVGTLFEDDVIRREHLSVTVYNTTDMPTLGSRVGRMLNRVGVFVVRVGNDSPTVDRCTVSGEAVAAKSVTARTIASIFRCVTVVKPSEAGDLDVRVGTAYQARFLPSAR